MCRQDSNLSDTSTAVSRRDNPSGTPPGEYSVHQTSTNSVDNNDNGLYQSTPTSRYSKSRGQRSSGYSRKINRSGTPPGGCSSRQLFVDTSDIDSFKRVDVKSLFASAHDGKDGGHFEENMKCNGLSIVEIMDKLRNTNSKTSGVISVPEINNAEICTGNNMSQSSLTGLKAPIGLGHQNLSIVDILQKANNSRDIKSKIVSTQQNQNQTVLKHQNKSIVDILQTAHSSRDNTSEVSSVRQHKNPTKDSVIDDSKNLTMNEIMQKLHISMEKLTFKRSNPAIYKRVRTQSHVSNEGKMAHPTSDHFTTDQMMQKRQDCQRANKSNRPTAFSSRTKYRGQPNEPQRESYPIPLPYTTGSDYEKPCMYVVEFPEPSQLPLPPPSFLQLRSKPTAIPKHMRIAMKSRFQ